MNHKIPGASKFRGQSKTFIFPSNSSKSNLDKYKELISIYQKDLNFAKNKASISNIAIQTVGSKNFQKKKELEQTLKLLNERLASLYKRKDEEILNIKNCEDKLFEVSINIDKKYEEYSLLSKKTILQKDIENEAFENYLTICQEKEKIAAKTKQELSYQRTKIKLLTEAISNREKEYITLKNKKKELVCLL